MKSCLSVSMSRLPRFQELDFGHIKTWDVSRLMLLLGSGPIFARDQICEPIYVDTFESSPDYTQWTFGFKEGTRFSDGSPLQAANWYHSVARNIHRGSGIHFNPKEDIRGASASTDGYCTGLVLDGNQVRIHLNSPNRNFAQLAGTVEASVLPIMHASQDPSIFGVSSGPYVLSEHDSHRYGLKINQNYPGHRNRVPFDTIDLAELSDEDAFSGGINGDLDFIYPSQVPCEEVRKQIHMKMREIIDDGVTYFISVRGSKDAASPGLWAQNLSFRQKLASLLKDIPNFDGVEKSQGLLIGNGLGRLNEYPEFSINLDLSALPSLSIAAVDEPISRHIVQYLIDAGLSVNVTWVEHFNKLYEGAARYCDVMIGNNDFSGFDPYISLYNAFNPDRPLIYDAEEIEWRDRLSRIQSLSEPGKKDKEYRDLQYEILSSSMVIPVFKKVYYFYTGKKLNLDGFVNPAFWTVQR